MIECVVRSGNSGFLLGRPIELSKISNYEDVKRFQDTPMTYTRIISRQRLPGLVPQPRLRLAIFGDYQSFGFCSLNTRDEIPSQS